MKKVKKKTRKPLKLEFHCDVPDCARAIHMGWEASGTAKKICKHHFKRHVDEDDDFNFFDLWDVPRLGLDVDKFGFTLAYDHDAIAEEIKLREKKEKDVKKEESIEKLKDWKKKNGNVKRTPKPKPRPEQKAAMQTEADDIVTSILFGD